MGNNRTQHSITFCRLLTHPPPGQNERYFKDSTLERILLMKTSIFRSQFYCQSVARFPINRNTLSEPMIVR